jgi:hypothetical protein
MFQVDIATEELVVGQTVHARTNFQGDGEGHDVFYGAHKLLEKLSKVFNQ